MKSRIGWPRFKLEPTTLNLILLSALLTVIFFILQGDVGLHIADEGFLWYGTIRTALGEVPIRDFQAYDPGRYYWGALWFKIIGSDGLRALRISQAVFQFFGLSAALLLLRRVLRGWLALLAAAAILITWMFPPFKIFEPVITIFALYFAVLLVEKPSRSRHLVAGIFVGLAAVFGRNHGLYCFVSFLLLILFVWWKIDRGPLAARVVMWGSGVVVGYSPMLFMLAFVPGFFGSFVESNLAILRQGTTLPLPVPWPWTPNYSELGLRYSINPFAVGVLYLALPLFYLFAWLKLLFTKELGNKSLLIACTFVGTVYLHYAFDRPHVFYLAWTIQPFLMGLMALPHSLAGSHKKVLTVVVVSSLLVFTWAGAVMHAESYLFVKLQSFVEMKLKTHLYFMPDEDMVKMDIAGDRIWVRAYEARIISGVKAVNQELIPPDEEVLIAPHWTTLYPILRKKSPLWEIYFLYPETMNKQEKMADDLEREKINWAIVCPNARLDNREELTFQNTHGYVWQYLVTNFEPIPTSHLPSGCDLLRRRPKGTDTASPGPSVSPGR